MKIGFIGFGKVAKNLTGLIDSENITFLTSAQNRSENTIENMKKSDVEILDTFKEVAAFSDILISANSPSQALDIAAEYGKYSKEKFRKDGEIRVGICNRGCDSVWST